MNNKDDDFVEVFSMVLVYGKDWFDNVVCATAQQSTITDAYGALTQKLALVESYMRDTWGIEMFDDEMGNCQVYCFPSARSCSWRVARKRSLPWTAAPMRGSMP